MWPKMHLLRAIVTVSWVKSKRLSDIVIIITNQVQVPYASEISLKCVPTYDHLRMQFIHCVYENAVTYPPFDLSFLANG